MPHANPLHILNPDDPRWLNFIEDQPEAVIFHHPAWIGTIAESYRYHPFILAHCSPGGEILAALPMMEVKSFLTGRRWVSLPFSDYCPPLARQETDLQEFTKRLTTLASHADTPRIELRWNFPQHKAIHPYQAHVLHINQLEADYETTFGKLHKRMRKHIRQAERSELYVETGTTLEDMQKFYRLQLETRRRHGVPVQPRKFFDLLGTRILQAGLGMILTAYLDDRLLAGLVLLHYQNTVTLKYSGDTRDYDKLKPNYLLDNAAIRWSQEHGFKNIDYGRSAIENEGLRKYKTRLGAEESPLIYGVIGAEPPQPGEGKIMTAMETVISHSPLFICRAAGEILYRHVG